MTRQGCEDLCFIAVAVAAVAAVVVKGECTKLRLRRVGERVLCACVMSVALLAWVVWGDWQQAGRIQRQRAAPTLPRRSPL